MKRADGFTLMELLVVLAIMALAGVLSLPLLQRAQPQTLVEQTAGQVVSALRRARELSLASNQQTRVMLDLGQRVMTADGVAEQVKFPDGVALQALSEGGAGLTHLAQYRFFPSGGSTGGTIDMASGGRVIRIKLNWVTGAITQESVTNEE
jgi:general secretion pathway protein H